MPGRSPRRLPAQRCQVLARAACPPGLREASASHTAPLARFSTRRPTPATDLPIRAPRPTSNPARATSARTRPPARSTARHPRVRPRHSGKCEGHPRLIAPTPCLAQPWPTPQPSTTDVASDQPRNLDPHHDLTRPTSPPPSHATSTHTTTSHDRRRPRPATQPRPTPQPPATDDISTLPSAALADTQPPAADDASPPTTRTLGQDHNHTRQPASPLSPATSPRPRSHPPGRNPQCSRHRPRQPATPGTPTPAPPGPDPRANPRPPSLTCASKPAAEGPRPRSLRVNNGRNAHPAEATSPADTDSESAMNHLSPPVFHNRSRFSGQFSIDTVARSRQCRHNQSLGAAR